MSKDGIYWVPATPLASKTKCGIDIVRDIKIHSGSHSWYKFRRPEKFYIGFGKVPQETDYSAVARPYFVWFTAAWRRPMCKQCDVGYVYFDPWWNPRNYPRSDRKYEGDDIAMPDMDFISDAIEQYQLFKTDCDRLTLDVFVRHQWQSYCIYKQSKLATDATEQAFTSLVDEHNESFKYVYSLMPEKRIVKTIFSFFSLLHYRNASNCSHVFRA